MIRFQCPECQSIMTAGNAKAGEKIFCPKCGQKLKIPPPPPKPKRLITVLARALPEEEPRRDKTVLGEAVAPPALASSRKAPPQPPDGSRILACPGCSKFVRVLKEHLGMKVSCPRCKTEFASG